MPGHEFVPFGRIFSKTPTPNPSRGEGCLDTLTTDDATSNANQAPLPSGGAGGGCQGAGGGCQEVGSGSVALHIFPIAALDLSLDYDHVRRQIATDTYKHMSLFNASAQYKWKRLVLRLELDNLLNQRNYAYTVFDGINTYTYDYGLCGRTAMLRATFKL